MQNRNEETVSMNSLFTVFDKRKKEKKAAEKTGNRGSARARKREAQARKSYECLGMRKLNGNMMGRRKIPRSVHGVMLKRK